MEEHNMKKILISIAASSVLAALAMRTAPPLPRLNSLALPMNPQGDIVGGYNSAGVFHGFLLSDGDFTSIDVPGANRTTAAGINARGDIAGRYVTEGVSHAFSSELGPIQRH